MEILKKSQRNDLWRALAASGLPVSEFSYQTVPAYTYIGDALDDGWIVHAPSDSSFYLFPQNGSSLFTCRSCVGDDPWVVLDDLMNFSEIIGHVRSWSSEIPEWMKTPDLWESMPDSAVIPGDLSPDSDNAPFTPEEQALISAQLKEILESIKETHDLTAEQSAELDKKFEEAEKASQRMGRKDWGLLFGGAVFSLILADVITPGIAGHILMMIEHGIGHLFGGPPVGGIMSGGQG